MRARSLTGSSTRFERGAADALGDIGIEVSQRSGLARRTHDLTHGLEDHRHRVRRYRPLQGPSLVVAALYGMGLVWVLLLGALSLRAALISQEVLPLFIRRVVYRPQEAQCNITGVAVAILATGEGADFSRVASAAQSSWLLDYPAIDAIILHRSMHSSVGARKHERDPDLLGWTMADVSSALLGAEHSFRDTRVRPSLLIVTDGRAASMPPSSLCATVDILRRQDAPEGIALALCPRHQLGSCDVQSGAARTADAGLFTIALPHVSPWPGHRPSSDHGCFPPLPRDDSPAPPPALAVRLEAAASLARRFGEGNPQLPNCRHVAVWARGRFPPAPRARALTGGGTDALVHVAPAWRAVTSRTEALRALRRVARLLNDRALSGADRIEPVALRAAAAARGDGDRARRPLAADARAAIEGGGGEEDDAPGAEEDLVDAADGAAAPGASTEGGDGLIAAGEAGIEQATAAGGCVRYVRATFEARMPWHEGKGVSVWAVLRQVVATCDWHAGSSAESPLASALPVERWACGGDRSVHVVVPFKGWHGEGAYLRRMLDLPVWAEAGAGGVPRTLLILADLSTEEELPRETLDRWIAESAAGRGRGGVVVVRAPEAQFSRSFAIAKGLEASAKEKKSAGQGPVVVLMDTGVAFDGAFLADCAALAQPGRTAVNPIVYRVADPEEVGDWSAERLARAGRKLPGEWNPTGHGILAAHRDDLLAAGAFDPAFGWRWGCEDARAVVTLQRHGVALLRFRAAGVVHAHVHAQGNPYYNHIKACEELPVVPLARVQRTQGQRGDRRRSWLVSSFDPVRRHRIAFRVEHPGDSASSGPEAAGAGARCSLGRVWTGWDVESFHIDGWP